MLGLRSAVPTGEISDEADLQLLCRASSRGGSKMGTGNLGQGTGDREVGAGNWDREVGRELG